ncbi:MAG: ABC transporter permease [Kineosporiaceae bacterium]
MTTDTIGGPSGRAPSGQPPRAEARREGAWRVGWRGARTVAVLELRQRVRSTRWLVVLAVWVAALAALTFLIRHAVYSTLEQGSLPGEAATPAGARHHAAATLFGIVVFLVLSLGGLVAPALTATSVNGDRAAGVLAALQTTMLTPAEIALGKLAAAWVTALALLVTASPFILWAFVDGGTPAGRLLTTLGVLALTLLVVCAIGLGWSAVTTRTSSSTVLTYLSVVFLGLGLPIVFALTLPLVDERDLVQVNGNPGGGACRVFADTRDQLHTERSWWLLAPNPYVVVADAAPRAAPMPHVGIDDPLTAIRDGVREARLGPSKVIDECFPEQAASLGPSGTQTTAEDARDRQRDELPAAWPYGLAADLAVGAAFTTVAVHRLRAPTRRLPRGSRVA